MAGIEKPYREATTGIRGLKMTGTCRLAPLLASMHSMAPAYTLASTTQQYRCPPTG